MTDTQALIERLEAMDREVTHIEVDAEVRYWEDATVNGIVDTAGVLIPGRDGDAWKVRIRLADGVIEDWPANTIASIHYKVCDAGEYWLSAGSVRLFKYRSDYVPDEYLCHGDDGYGDYIIMTVGPTGQIENYEQPDFDPDRWVPITTLRNALPEIIAALREREGEGWRPIETAPKDGSWIMGWAERDSAPYRISWGANHDGRLTWCTAFGSFYDGYITHWTPLPPTGSAAAHAEVR